MSMGFQVAVCAVLVLRSPGRGRAVVGGPVAEASENARRGRRHAGEPATACPGRRHSVVRSCRPGCAATLTASRAVAYALVGLADGRMLHHPAGGLERWRDRLLEFELYGSALAGQEVVAQARAAVTITEGTAAERGHLSFLAPFYLGVFRAGFEGSLRGDAIGLSSLIAALEEAVGAHRQGALEVAPDVRPKRMGLAPLPLAVLGLAAWLAAGFAVWLALSGQSLEESDRMAQRLASGLPATADVDP